MIPAGVVQLIERFPLGNVATIGPEGWPAVSPKGTFLVTGPDRLSFGVIRSPGTVANLRADPRLEVTFIDPFLRKGARLRGAATLEAAEGERLAPFVAIWPALAPRITEIVEIIVERVLPLTTPPYDDGVTEAEMVALYKAKYAELYP